MKTSGAPGVLDTLYAAGAITDWSRRSLRGQVLAMSTHGYAKDFFENGSNLGGFIECPESLSDTAYTRFNWQATYSGVANQHKIGFLEDGLKFSQLGRNPNESQALESRKFEVTEICRIFGVPPYKVFDLDRATFSNIEQQNIEYVQESITPMAVRLEETIYKDLLTTAEQLVYYAKFNVNALLRGDIAARTTYYNSMRQNGVFSANDIRDMEDLNRIRHIRILVQIMRKVKALHSLKIFAKPITSQEKVIDTKRFILLF